MKHEPEPPPITIVDPRAPAPGTADLLDHGRDHWRPSRYQRTLAALVAAIVALVSGGVAEIRHVRHEQALDAAALAGVSMAVEDDAEGDDDGAPRVSVQNQGDQRLHLIGARLVGDGYAEQPLDVDVDAHSTAAIDVAPNPTCRTSMYIGQAEELEVRARTSRGGLVTRTLTLPEDVADWLGYLERNRCGYLRPEEALISEVVATGTRHDGVHLRMRFTNTGVEPVTVSDIRVFVGIRTSAHLPLRLAGRRDPRGASRTLDVVLHVTSCKALLELADQIGAPEDVLPPLMLATVANRYVTSVTTLPLASADDELGTRTDPVELLVGSCP